jgi:hypothetical protein
MNGSRCAKRTTGATNSFTVAFTLTGRNVLGSYRGYRQSIAAKNNEALGPLLVDRNDAVGADVIVGRPDHACIQARVGS